VNSRKHNVAISRWIKCVEAVMAGDAKSRNFSFESFLFGLSLVYGSAVKFRAALFKHGILRSRRLPCKVISIGNITAGGTGKTPMTLYVTQLVQRLGYTAAIISRGYKGNAEKAGGVVSDGRAIHMGPDTAGDEAYMMATKTRNTPLVVGQNRFKAGMLAVQEFDPQVIVLDDAFQHLPLNRDIDLVLMDQRRPLGNTHLLPRGVLREPTASLHRADAFILTRCDPNIPGPPAVLKRFSQKRPIFRSFHRPHIRSIITGKDSQLRKASQSAITSDLEYLKGRKAYCFSGIAGNDNVRQTVEGFSCDLTGFKGFPDHHPYSTEDLETIFRSARDSNTDLLLTTEKDYARISQMPEWPVELVIIGINIVFEDDTSFNVFLKHRLAEGRS